MKYIVVLYIMGLFLSQATNAQESVNEQSKKEKKKEMAKRPPQKGDIYFSPVPVFGVNPAFGFIYGVGASTSAFLGDPKTTNISNVLAGLAYSTRNQLICTVKSMVYTADNDWILLGDWRYLNSSQPTFGLGTGPQSAKLVGNGSFAFNDNANSKPLENAQMMQFQFFRFYETALKKVGKDLYAGIGIHADLYSNIKDNLLDTLFVPAVITSNYAYNVKNGFDQNKNSLVGISFNGIYDTRDNQNCPWSGRYAYASFKVNPSFLGSTKNSSTLWLEYRDYFNFTPDHHNILGWWTFGNFTTSGTLPYMGLPALGWDQFGKSGRGYVQGRFRGQSLVYSELEYRKHLLANKTNPDFMGMVAFLNMTTASSTGNNIALFKYIEPGYGLGLRVMMSKKARSNVDIDYAWGSYGSHGFYIRLNETF